MNTVLVKHLEADFGSIEKVYKTFRSEPPYACTSKTNAAENAVGGTAYVVVSTNTNPTKYLLAYKFKIAGQKPAIHPNLWLEKFKHKLHANPTAPTGLYYEKPQKILDTELDKWLRNLGPRGMTELQPGHITALEEIFTSSTERPRAF